MRAFSSTLHTMLFSLAVKGSHLSSEDSLPGIILPYPSLDRSVHMLVSCNRICQNSGHISLGILQRYLRTFISYVDKYVVVLLTYNVAQYVFIVHRVSSIVWKAYQSFVLISISHFACSCKHWAMAYSCHIARSSASLYGTTHIYILPHQGLTQALRKALRKKLLHLSQNGSITYQQVWRKKSCPNRFTTGLITMSKWHFNNADIYI